MGKVREGKKNKNQKITIKTVCNPPVFCSRNRSDVEALQDRILKLVSEDRLRREFSEKGAQLIREAFSLKASIERLEHFYEEICK